MSRILLVAAVLCASLCVAYGSRSAFSVQRPVTDFDTLMQKYADSEWKEEYTSLLQVSEESEGSSSGGGSSGGGGAEASLVGACEVCVFVIENKEQHQPYLCRGLKDPNYQKACVEVMESLMWWITNEVYWLNYGCQRSMNGAVEWVRPCPAHAVCSWIENLYTRTPFCPADPFYKKPA